MDTLNLNGLEATLLTHMTLLLALVETHPDKPGFLRAFSRQMSHAIEDAANNPEVGGRMHAMEELLRELIRGPDAPGAR